MNGFSIISDHFLSSLMIAVGFSFSVFPHSGSPHGKFPPSKKLFPPLAVAAAAVKSVPSQVGFNGIDGGGSKWEV